MKILVLIDDSRASLRPEAEAACVGIAADQHWQTGLTLPDGNWDAVLITPGPDGIPEALRTALTDTFSVAVEPENTHANSIDHAPTGTDAILLGAGIKGYALAIRTCLARAA